MNKSGFRNIGFIKKPFGYKGEMIFIFKYEEVEQLNDLNFIFFDIDNELVPFYIEKIDFRDEKTAIAKIEDINNSDDSKKFTGCFLYLPERDMKLTFPDKRSLENLIGYRAIDLVLGNIGKIEGIMSLSEQELITIDYNGKEVLIPVVDEIIIKIDHHNREVHLQTPEGLIDL